MHFLYRKTPAGKDCLNRLVAHSVVFPVSLIQTEQFSTLMHAMQFVASDKPVLGVTFTRSAHS